MAKETLFSLSMSCFRRESSIRVRVKLRVRVRDKDSREELESRFGSGFRVRVREDTYQACVGKYHTRLICIFARVFP